MTFNIFFSFLHSNALCGSLQCSGGSIIFDNINSANSLTSYVRFVGSFECRSVTTPSTVDEVSPGLVTDGAKCGTDRVSNKDDGNKFIIISLVRFVLLSVVKQFLR